MNIRNYINRKDVFCDAFNFFYHSGVKVISADKLKVFKVDDDFINRYPDIAAVSYEDETCDYVLIGLSKQEERISLICLAYYLTLVDRQKENSYNKDIKQLVVYFGNDEWNVDDIHKVSIETYRSDGDNQLKELPINMLQPISFNEEDIRKFDSNLCSVMLKIKENVDVGDYLD